MKKQKRSPSAVSPGQRLAPEIDSSSSVPGNDADRAEAFVSSLAALAAENCGIGNTKRSHFAEKAPRWSRNESTSSSDRSRSPDERVADAFVSSLASTAAALSKQSRQFRESSDTDNSDNTGRAVVTSSAANASSGSGEERLCGDGCREAIAALPSHHHPVHSHAAIVAHPEPYLSSSSDKIDDQKSSLLEPFREPCFHTIKQTFKQITRRGASRKRQRLDDINECRQPQKRTRSSKQLLASRIARRGCVDSIGDDSGVSSGSGTETGYAGSSSSNGFLAVACSTPSSEDSSEDGGVQEASHRGRSGDPRRPMLSKKLASSLSMSSEIADFSSSMDKSLEEGQSESSSITSSFNEGGEEDDRKPPAIRSNLSRHNRHDPGWLSLPLQMRGKAIQRDLIEHRKHAAIIIVDGKPPILALGCDIMAHVLTFLEPPTILDVLTMPLSKDWLRSYTRQPELWRVLCLLDPFKARVDENDNGSENDDQDDDGSDDSYPYDNNASVKMSFGKYRLLYTSFVKCMRYLVRIKDDAVNGRPLSVIDSVSTEGNAPRNIATNQNLQEFLARARRLMPPTAVPTLARQLANVPRVGLSEDDSVASSDTPSEGPKRKRKHKKIQENSKKQKTKFGHSKLTQRLLGPSSSGHAGETDLPWSCGIYSVVNWMVAFSDVEGIQTMSLKVLPSLLENEQQRITAQRAGLTDIVLRAMVLFPESAALHTAAFHTIVLLARPLGGREGMLFHTSMVNSSGIFNSAEEGSATGKSGIAVLLDSMKRFQNDEVLQSMGCWSLVNIALAPAQKEVLVKLGGIEVTVQAMMEHPFNAEVQFRALFALINLVIPSVSLNRPEVNNENIAAPQEQGVIEEDTTETEMLEATVDEIIELVVLAMKNFCSNEAILNRACLVLHNLSLSPNFHGAMLWNPSCYQMLEWCLSNYRTDQVLQQSAAGTLHRLQTTLSSDESLRARFTASIQAQQQQSLEKAHREALLFHAQHEQRLRSSINVHSDTEVNIPEGEDS